MAENGMSPADVAAVTRPNFEGTGYGNYGWGNGFGNDFVWIILLFALFGFGGGGFGWGGGNFAGNITTDSGLLGYALGNNATKTDLSDGLNSVQTMNKLDNLTAQVNGELDAVQMQMCNGFNATQREILQGDNATQREMLQGFNSQNILALQNTAELQRGLDANRFTSQQNTSQLQASLAAMDAQNFRNTCDVLNAIHNDGEQTRAVLVSNKIADLEEKLAERARELQTAQIEASQQAQTNSLISALRPTPIPSYLTCSPYMSNYLASTGCGCGMYS